MISFEAIIKRFRKQGEKTGWTYILIPSEYIAQLNPPNRRSFRVKGRIDQHPVSMATLAPMGGGDYILALNAAMRKGIGKPLGEKVAVKLELDHGEVPVPPELMECLADEPSALERFNSLTKSHRNYYFNWINSARTDPTRSKRIAATVDAMLRGWDFGQTLRNLRETK